MRREKIAPAIKRKTVCRCELTDKEWEQIDPLISVAHTGRPQKDIRAHLNGIMWLARSGARWSDLSTRFGPHQTVYSCFCRWRDDGTLRQYRTIRWQRRRCLFRYLLLADFLIYLQ